MIQNLPVFEFAWEKVENFTPEKIEKLFKTDKKGYILEVDGEYPKELDNNHNELPFLVENLVPNLKD